LQQEEYKKEGVPWNDIKFKDNIACIDLYERPSNGLIALMVEEAMMPKGSDKQLIVKLSQNHGQHAFFSTPCIFMAKWDGLNSLLLLL